MSGPRAGPCPALTGFPAGRRPARRLLASLLATGLLMAGSAAAGTLAAAARHSLTDYCSSTAGLTVQAQDRRLQFADLLRRTLDESGASVAVVARNGLDLRRIGQRWSHAGLSLREGLERPWAVRQLYYACDERRPRLFDQGLAGFVFGIDTPPGQPAEVVLWLLPPGAAAETLAQAGRDTPRALRLLAAQYSANSHAYSTRYQNCNQWLAELIGVAWGGLPDGPALRERAQAWLADAGYAPTRVEPSPPWLLALAAWLPYVHLDDHPAADRAAGVLRVSLPAAIGGFVARQVPGVRRVALCLRDDRVVLRRDGPDFDEACSPGAGDELHPLD